MRLSKCALRPLAAACALAWVGVLALTAAGCGGAALKAFLIAVDLPEQYNTPDGMILAPDGTIILSCPNFNDDKYPAKMLRIDASDKLSEIIALPVHPETGKVGPLGCDIGADGNLYICDNQAFGTDQHKSRLLRVVADARGVRGYTGRQRCRGVPGGDTGWSYGRSSASPSGPASEQPTDSLIVPGTRIGKGSGLN
jgi:hypothetical protein